MKKMLLILSLLFMPYIIYAQGEIPREVNDLTEWLGSFDNPSQILVEEESKKTATVYNEEEKIYRIDITTKSDLYTFTNTLDLGFMLDVSNSMLFPSKMAVYQANYPIYRINMYGSGLTQLNRNEVYYLIGDENESATVFRLYFYNGYWHAHDASKEASEENTFRIGLDKYKMPYTDTEVLYPFSNGDTINDVYTIYRNVLYNPDGTVTTRLDDLKTSLYRNYEALNIILPKTDIGKNSLTAPDARIAYNTFNNRVTQYQPNFISIHSQESITMVFSTAGGTHTDYAIGAVDLEDGSPYQNQNRSAATFNWDHSHLKYGILITDGAPTSSGLPIDNQSVIDAANVLKDKDVNLITVGVGMENVPRGRELLYTIASSDDDGKFFYHSNDGNELANIFLQIIKDLISEVSGIGNIVDVISEDFYPVDKETGEPLKDGDRIKLDGRLVDSNYTGYYGTIKFEDDKYKVEWTHQIITHDGWHGTVYIKAKDGVHGENISTNFGEATINCEQYRVPKTDLVEELKDNYKSNIELASPKVVIKLEKEATEEIDISDTKKIKDVFPELGVLGATEISIKDKNILKIEDDTIVPLAIGSTDVEFEVDSIRYTIHVLVSHIDASPVPDKPSNEKNPHTGDEALLFLIVLIMGGVVLILFSNRFKKVKTI